MNRKFRFNPSIIAYFFVWALFFVVLFSLKHQRSTTVATATNEVQTTNVTPVATATNEVQAVIYTVPTEEEAMYEDAAKWCELRISEIRYWDKNRDLFERCLESIRLHQKNPEQPLNIHSNNVLAFATAWRELERGGKEALQKRREGSEKNNFLDNNRRRENRR